MKNEIYKNIEWLYDMYINKKYGSSYIANYCNVDDSTIIYYLKKYKIPVRPRSESVKNTKAKKYDVNENYFEIIDNEHKAYWLGFLMADGTMREYRKGCYQLSFELQESDKYIIEQFKQDINSTHPISVSNNTLGPNKRARLIITNYTFCQHLIAYGIVPHKTGKEIVPNTIPNIYIKDFMRGFFDGDGCVRFYNQTDTTCKGKFHIVSCSRKILNSFLHTLPVNFSKCALHLKINTNHIYELETNGIINIIKIYDYLYYDNCICLKRKEDIFKRALIYFKNSKRLTKRYSPIH